MKERILKIKALVLDIDGVLTDGKIIVDTEGREIKVFDVQDGFGVVFFKKLGFKTAVITSRKSKAVTFRTKDLKFDKVYQDAYPKTKAYQSLLKDLKVKADQICYVGDDLLDLQVMKKSGFAVAVANAAPEVKRVAHYVTRKSGGNGAVREVVELILKTQGKWQGFLEKVGN